MAKRIIEESDLICTVSEFTKSRLIDICGAKPDRICVVGNGCDLALFSREDNETRYKTTEFKSAGPYFAVIGEICPRKGDDRIAAFADRLAKIRPDARILVSGHRAAGQCPMPRNVIPLGYLQADILPAFLRGAVAMICLSRYEGFGIPLVEAMAAGTPILAANNTALPEVVGGAGILVDADNVDILADAAMSLLNSETLRQKLIILGRERSREFSWDRCAERLHLALLSAGQ